MMIRRAAAVAAVAGGTLLASAGAALAHHNAPEVEVDAAECGAAVLTAAWPGDDHQVDNTALVVDGPGGVQTAPIGEEIPVQVDDGGDVRYRVWGGGERDYDSPALDDLDALLAHLDAGGSPTDPDAPGVAWESLTVEACEDGDEGGEDDESEDEGTDEEDDGSEDEGTDEDGDDEGQEEGGGAECVDVNTADAETLRQLRHVDEDRAGQIMDLRPFSSPDDLDRVNGLKAGGPRLAELIAGGGEWLPLCPIDAPDEEQGGGDDKPAPAEQADAGGSLPVTGAALAALVAAGALALGGGGTAWWAARRRK